MCQLTYIQTNNNNVKKALLTNLLMINASDGHKDGFGIYSESVIKSELDGSNTYFSALNLSDTLPVIGHVRKASFNYSKKLGVEFSHPFGYNNENRELILAHNGTLTPIEGFVPTNLIDSQFFAQTLFENLAKNRMPSAFTQTVEKFYGKFAFLMVYNNSYYIARGKTANLYYANLEINDKPAGFVVNTQLNTLLAGLVVTSNNLSTLCGIKLRNSVPVLLDENSLYYVVDIVGNKFETSTSKLDVEFKEKYKPVVAQTTFESPYHGYNNDGYSRGLCNNKQTTIIGGNSNNKNSKNALEKIMMLSDRCALSLFELSHLYFCAFGESIIEANYSSLDSFADILKVLEKDYWSKNRIKTFQELVTNSGYTLKTIYNQGIIPFPAWICEPNEIKRLMKLTVRKLSKGNKDG